jgi:hypothetical protein
LRSEEFDDAYWGKSGGTTVSGNTNIAPNGTLTADSVTLPSGGTINKVFSSLSITSGNSYTFSCFVRSATQVITFGGATSGAGTVVYNGAVDVGSGWFRQSVTRTWTATGTFNIQLIWTEIFGFASGDIWGAQLETGSVATSYIPTVAATATRNADVISKTGVSGFIGQSQGSVYAEFNVSAIGVEGYVIRVGTANFNNTIYIFRSVTNTVGVAVRSNGASTFLPTSFNAGLGFVKVAVAYANNDFAFYVNGAQIATSTASLSFTDSLAAINLGAFASNTAVINDRIRAAAIYPTRLSNAELAALTTL